MVGRRGRSERRKKEEEGIKYPVTPSKTPSNYWAILLFLPAFRQDHPVAGEGGEKKYTGRILLASPAIGQFTSSLSPVPSSLFKLFLAERTFEMKRAMEETVTTGARCIHFSGKGREGGLTCLFFSLSPPQPRSVYIEEGETGWLMSKA